MNVTADVWHCCVQCSYRSEWKFQADRHFARNHTHFNHPSDFSDVKTKLDEYQHNDFTPFCKLAPYEHRQASANTDWYKCERCSFSTNAALMLTKHASTCRAIEQISHGTELVIVPSSDCSYGNKQLKQADSYNCVHCSYETNLFGAFRNHNLSHLRHEAAEWFNCEHCPYVTKQWRHLKRHIATDHKLKRVKPAIEWFECKQCSYKSKYKSDLKRHSLQHYSHDAIKWFECLQCSFKTKTAWCLTMHALRHAPDEAIAWHKCAECSYKAKRRNHLTRHLRIYHDDSNETNTTGFGCKQCPYRAKSRAQLKRHASARHSNFKQVVIDKVEWLECGQCSYRSKMKSSVRRHKLLEHKIVE